MIATSFNRRSKKVTLIRPLAIHGRIIDKGLPFIIGKSAKASSGLWLCQGALLFLYLCLVFPHLPSPPLRFFPFLLSLCHFFFLLAPGSRLLTPFLTLSLCHFVTLSLLLLLLASGTIIKTAFSGQNLAIINPHDTF